MDHIGPEEWVDRFGNEPRKGADILVQCLEREGAYRYSLLLKPASRCSAPSRALCLVDDYLRSVQNEGALTGVMVARDQGHVRCRPGPRKEHATLVTSGHLWLNPCWEGSLACSRDKPGMG